jgi:hypothetical protein
MIVVLEEMNIEGHCVKMPGHAHNRTTCTTCIPNGIGQSSCKIKLMVINGTEKTNNYDAARKFSVSEANV